mgnify:CR=1 FL=1
MYIAVREINVDQALRVLKKKMQREGLFREMKNRRAFEKPSERRAREAAFLRHGPKVAEMVVVEPFHAAPGAQRARCAQCA